MSWAEPFAHVGEPRIRKLLEHWLEVRRGRRIPARRQIDPVQIASLLPIVWICDSQLDGVTFRVRLAGEEVARMYPGDIRGRSLGDLYSPEQWSIVEERMRRVVSERCIAHLRGTIYGFSGRTGQGERIILPLADDGWNVDAIIGASAYAWGGIVPSDRSSDWRDLDVTFTAVAEIAEGIGAKD